MHTTPLKDYIRIQGRRLHSLDHKILTPILFMALLQGSLVSGQDPVVRLEVRLVQIEVRITRDGKPVDDLKLEDFILEEDGEVQKISHLEYVTVPGLPGLLAPSTDSMGLSETTERILSDSDDASSSSPIRTDSDTWTGRRPLTWIYVLPEVQNAAEFQRMAPAIKDFLIEELAPDFLISLGGLPFTNNRDLLLAALHRMVEAPYGNEKGKGAIDPTHFHLDDLMFQREIAAAMQQQTDLLANPGFTREPMNSVRMDQVTMFSVEKVDRQISFFGRMALFRYLDLVERLAAYPGKKVIVLFRSGFRIDSESSELMTQLAAVALRHRVSMYVTDSRGLEAAVPVDDRRMALAWSHRRRRRQDNIFWAQQLQNESKAGLVTLAKETGGKAVIDTNDMGTVLERVAADAKDYYVLGFYPGNLKEAGRFRKLEVRVNRVGLEIDAPRGYFERKAHQDLSGGEKTIFLRQVMNSAPVMDLPLSANHVILSQEGGSPVMVYSVGTPLKVLSAKEIGKQPELNVTVMLRLSDALLQKLPIYQEQEIRHRMEKADWQETREDDLLFLSYGSQIPLSPGAYDLKIVFLDENSGNVGSYTERIEVPDFRRSSAPGPLLLSRELLEKRTIENDSNGPVDFDLLEAGGYIYLPQPSTLFRQGDPVYVLFHLYNPTEEDVVEASQGMQIALLRNGEPVENVDAYGEPIIDRDAKVIRYTAGINSATLAPGEYTLIAVLPSFRTRRVPHLEKNFAVIPAR
jgi:VWFA-related protein